MNKKYQELFSLVARSVANTAEQVMENNEKIENQTGIDSAKIMRDDFLNLYYKLQEEAPLNKADYSRLLIGTIIVAKQLQIRLETQKNALTGYTIDVIPKLDRINNTNDEEAACSLAAELFNNINSENENDKSNN